MDSRRKRRLRMIAAGIALVCVLYGAARGEVEILWNKAVHICLECIGLG